MPERDATLDAFISSSTEEDADAETAAEASDVREEGDVEFEDEANDDAVPAADSESVSVDSESESALTDPESSESERVSESAVTTMAWSPAGEACEACGETTLRRWRTDSGFLCPSCVDWERTPNQ